MATPLPTEELQQIALGACESVFSPVEKYDHTKVAEWNSAIINNILQTLIDKTATGESKQPAYKYIANSTIIQHPGNPSEATTVGRRGMHSAVGAFWNTEKDGTYSYKWDGAEKKGMDVVISINWVGL
ncbi:hypothetical protein K458DRAFT_426279 [Lentithecium fluviatile CBS 122367]|uniref:Tctex-1 n=1 Tax=Lentithecium fluviatile CBS 122367 TaxID=1168545 RepID=A0A6G1JK45_9PLEO|nr:hypothetical protein K458DRAFT_426279 [Lentithecium fluviatile CBS 122367]